MRARRLMTSLSLVGILAVSGIAASGCAIVETPRPIWWNANVDLGAEFKFAMDIKNSRGFWGQREITLHGNLTDKARWWSQQMASGACHPGKICHSHLTYGIHGVVYSWSLIGENVGVGGNLQALWDAFMNSPPHRANVLDSRWDYVGVGVIRSGNTYYATMVFMRG